jgi:hypothetical protein
MANKGKETHTEEPKPIEQTAPEPAQTANVPATVANGSVATDGVRARRAIMLKHFIPDPDWINVNIVAKGKGTKVVIGRIFGFVTSTEEKMNLMPDGKQNRSVVCRGVLQTESYLTGETSEASMVFFPAAYSEKIEACFAADPQLRVVEVDCDVGLEATGKTIPYEWVVIAYREGAEMAVLHRLKKARGRPSGAPKLLAQEHQKALAQGA